jgi:hypothetical protein
MIIISMGCKGMEWPIVLAGGHRRNRTASDVARGFGSANTAVNQAVRARSLGPASIHGVGRSPFGSIQQR